MSGLPNLAPPAGSSSKSHLPMVASARNDLTCGCCNPSQPRATRTTRTTRAEMAFVKCMHERMYADNCTCTTGSPNLCRCNCTCKRIHLHTLFPPTERHRHRNRSFRLKQPPERFERSSVCKIPARLNAHAPHKENVQMLWYTVTS